MQPWADVQAQFAVALLDAGRAAPPTVQGTADRFAVYRNNVVVSLLDALQDRFPVTCALVGEEFFRAMCRLFMQRHPPSSRMMMFYGDELPAFIASFEPASSVPYLADVASLESAWTYAYHAADAASLEISALHSMDARSLASGTVRLHPSVRLIRSKCAAASIWSAHQCDDLSAVDTQRPEDVLIVRPAKEVCVHHLAAGALTFVEALLSGRSIQQAAASALVDNAQFDAGAQIVALLSMGAVTAIDAHTREHAA